MRESFAVSRLAEPRWFGVYVLLALLVVFSLLLPETFPTVANFRAIGSNQAVGALLAVALVLPLTAGHFDLSIASLLTLASVSTAGLFQDLGAPVPVAIVGGIAAGAAFGALNGIGVAVVGVPSLIVTLASGSVALGLAQWWTDGAVFTQGIPTGFQDLGQGSLLGVPLPVVYAVAVATVLWWTLERTAPGRYLHAIGDNPSAARLTGLPTVGLTIAAFTVAGALAGLAGVLLTAKTGAGNPTIGASFLLPAFAAVFLGATIARPGQYNVVGTIVAVLVVAVGLAGLTQSGVPFYLEPVFTGVVLFAAVAATTVRRRRTATSRREGAGDPA